jgi:hypothetical protein
MRAIGKLFPWPTREHRRQAIGDAREQRLQSQRQAAHAELIRAAIERMSAENHFAAAIAEQIALRHRRGQEGP